MRRLFDHTVAAQRVAFDAIRPGGRIAIISFHSGEDRRVKQNFRDLHRASMYSTISADPCRHRPPFSAC